MSTPRSRDRYEFDILPPGAGVSLLVPPIPNTPLDNIKVTAAHEFNHAIQFGYDYWEETWLMEATATWIEDDTADYRFQAGFLNLVLDVGGLEGTVYDVDHIVADDFICSVWFLRYIRIESD